MKEGLIELFIIIPFILNGLSIGSGVLLFLWLFVERRIWRDRHDKNADR